MKISPMVLRVAALLVFILLVPKAFSKGSAFCESCREGDNEVVVTLEAFDHSFKRNVCEWCVRDAPRCFVCKLPALKESRLYDDKRLFCNRDFAAGVFESSEMGPLAFRTAADLNRVFWRFNMNFAATNLTVSLVSSATLYDLLGVRFNPQNADVGGLTITRCYDVEGKEVVFRERHKQPEGTEFRYEHEIYLANGFSEPMLRAILAHELAHVWLHENLPYERANNIDRHTVEGFCELVAYYLIENENTPNLKKAIRNNLYTMGQQNVLIEVESGYGFHRILQWFFNGTGRRLHNADLVRQVNESPVATRKPSTPAPVSGAVVEVTAHAATPQPAALPETVLLKGIFYGKRKSALVNNVTLSEGEEQMVKLAVGLTGVRCVEIRPASVILAVNGETKEYFVGLPPKDLVSGESKDSPPTAGLDR